ncbi:MAG: HypC/HybG/HupF family hydrogenase formation chaperone [Desulfobacterales bacterium]
MCLAIPSRITEIQGDMATIDVAGVKRQASLLLIDGPRTGDWVIVHAGFAIKKIDEVEAMESLRCLREAAEWMDRQEGSS